MIVSHEKTEIQKIADRIDELVKSAPMNKIELGMELATARLVVTDGSWYKWLEKRDISKRAASRYIKTAKEFAGKNVDNITGGALEMLFKADEAVKKEAFALSEGGVVVNTGTVLALVRNMFPDDQEMHDATIKHVEDAGGSTNPISEPHVTRGHGRD